MFDEICVFHSLFPPTVPSKLRTHIFQTKSFECKLEEYRITEELKLERYVRDPVDNEGGPRRGTWEPVAFSGVIKFYDLVRETPPYREVWHEFCATFLRGHLDAMIEYAGPGERFVD